MTFKQPKLLTEKEIYTIRGKAIVGHATPAELMSVFSHYDIIEQKLDESDEDDTFGTEGWRHRFGPPIERNKMTEEELKDPEDYYRQGVLDATKEFSCEEISILPVTEGFNSGVLRTFLSNRRKSLLETPETGLGSKWLSTLWGFKDGDPDERSRKETPMTSDYHHGVEDALAPFSRSELLTNGRLWVPGWSDNHDMVILQAVDNATEKRKKKLLKKSASLGFRRQI